jgi:hypothetical protein
MTAWPDCDPSTWDKDWCKQSFLAAFAAAINERHLVVLPGTGISAISVGADVAGAGFVQGIIYKMQGAVMSMVIYFADHTLPASHPGDWTGETGMTPFTSARWLAAAGLNAGGFRRYTVHPSDGGTVAYGLAQAGDLIDYWIFQDLMAGLKALQATTGAAQDYDWDSDGESLARIGYDGGATWAACKAASETAFDASSLYDAGHSPPSAYTIGTYDVPSGSGGWANMYRNTSHQVWTGRTSASGIGRQVDFYVATVAPSSIAYLGSDPAIIIYPPNFDNTFDGNGDWPGGYTLPGRWYKWSSGSGVVSGITGLSDEKFGPTDPDTHPTWCDQPGTLHAKVRGYATFYASCILWWNVAGGFEYQ